MTRTKTKVTVGGHIRSLRLARLLTQDDLARELGVKPTSVSRWERDEVPPSGLNRSRLGQFFTVHPDTFLP